MFISNYSTHSVLHLSCESSVWSFSDCVSLLRGTSLIPVETMGVALARAAQWTAAGSGTATLAITPLNESLLNQITKFAEDFSTRHPQEAAFVFREPLEWKTQLGCSVFGEGYEIK